MQPRFIAPFLVSIPLLISLPAGAEIPPETLREIFIHEQSRNHQDGVLVELTRHDEPDVRGRAFLALGRIQDVDLLDALTRGLKDKEESVRFQAVFALGQLFDSRAEKPLLDAWEKEKTPRVRRALVEALGKCGTQDSTLPVLSNLLVGDDPDLAGEAALALGNMAYRDMDISAAGNRIREVLIRNQPGLQWRAAFAAYRGKVSRSFTGLMRSLKSDDPNTLIYSCKTAGVLKNKNLGKLITPLVDHPDWRVRVEAIRAMAELRDRSLTGLAGLGLEDNNESVRLTAIEAMGKMSGGGGLVRLGTLGESSNWRERAAVLKAKAKGQGDATLLELKDAIKDPEWRIRFAAAEALTSIPSEQSLLLMEGMVNDQSPQVAVAVANGLAEYPQVHAVTLLRPFLSSGDPAILSAAATAIGDRMDRESVPGLIDAYEKLVSPVDTETMVVLLNALGSILTATEEDDPIGVLIEENRKRAMALLESALHDSDVTVARTAAQNLTDITGEPVEPAGEHIPQVSKDLDLDLALDLAARSKPIVARIETNRGPVVLELLGRDAPGTVANFVSLARRGYFNGLSFHRVVPDFVVQGGDPRGDGWGGPGYSIRCEYNPLRYERGMVGMALAGKDTGGSQFFITHSPQPHLNGRYTIFGRVTEGMEIVDKIQVGDLIDQVLIEGL